MRLTLNRAFGGLGHRSPTQVLKKARAGRMAPGPTEQPSPGITPDIEQIAQEAAIARGLLAASDSDRQQMYGSAYDAIYTTSLKRRGPSIDDQTFGASRRLLPLLEKISKPGQNVLEVGCGVGLLTIELGRLGRHTVGVDVSRVALDRARTFAEGVAEFELVSGTHLPYKDESFDAAFSVEVLEHLHEHDAPPHLTEMLRVLRPGGRYWIVTPNALLSRGSAARFGVDVQADGDVHLKEWTYSQLIVAARKAGFTNMRTPWRNYSLASFPLLPAGLKASIERPFATSPVLTKLAGITSVSILVQRPR